MKTVTRAYQGGVKFAYGTDAGVYPHGQNWEDFIYLVKAGLPPPTRCRWRRSTRPSYSAMTTS